MKNYKRNKTRVEVRGRPIYTDKTSLKADREVWGRGNGFHVVPSGSTLLHLVSLEFAWFRSDSLHLT